MVLECVMLNCVKGLRGHIRTPHLTASSPDTEKCSGGSPSPSKGVDILRGGQVKP